MNTQILFGMAPNLAADIELATFFIDRFIRSIFPIELKFLPRNFLPVSILVKTLKYMHEQTIWSLENEPTTNTQKTVEDEKYGLVRVERQILSKTFT